MAITILQEPELYALSADPQRYLVTSDNYTQTNFKYVFDIYDENDVLITRVKTHPLPAGHPELYSSTLQYGLLDVSKILASYIKPWFRFTITNDDICPYLQGEKHLKTYYIRFGEEYGTTPVIYPNLTTTAYFTSICGSYFPTKTFNYGTYTISSVNGTNARFLQEYTTAGYVGSSGDIGRRGVNPHYIRQDEHAYLSYLVTQSNHANKLKISINDGSGIYINKYIPLQVATISANYNKLQQVQTGFNLNKLTAGTFGITQPIIPPDTTDYYVQIVNNANAACSEVMYYKVDTNCYKNTVYRVHWLNNLGGINSFSFTGNSVKGKDTERKQYSVKDTYTHLNGGGYHDSHINMLDYTRSYNTSVKEKLTITTGWLTQSASDYVAGLFESPMVFIEDRDNDRAVQYDVITTSFEEKMENKIKVFDYTIELKPSYTRFNQAR